jgi:hypothetical protein
LLALEIEVASIKQQNVDQQKRLDLDRDMILKLGESMGVALAQPKQHQESWIVWEDRLALGANSQFVGPVPRKAIAAFGTQQECNDAIRKNAAANKGDPDQGTYHLRSESGLLNRVSMTCLPQSVAAK